MIFHEVTLIPNSIFIKTDDKNLGFAVRLGAEYVIPLADRELNPHFNLIGGFLFVWQITDLINLELGFDLISLMSMPPDGFIRPWVGAGFRF